MAHTCIDTQSVRAKGAEIDYWLNIDAIDSELSGTPLKYRSNAEVSDSLGVDEQIVRGILFRMRKSQKITTLRAKIDQ